MRDPAPAVAGHPDALTGNAAVQVAAALVFAYDGHQGAEKSRHGGGDYHDRYRFG